MERMPQMGDSTKTGRIFDGIFPAGLPGTEGQITEIMSQVFAAPVAAQQELFRGTTEALARAAHDYADCLDDLKTATTPTEVLARSGAYAQRVWQNGIAASTDLMSRLWSAGLRGSGKSPN